MGLQVRGECPKCHRVYDTEAPTGKATRRFRCDGPDCLGVVIARRIAPEELAATVTNGDAAPAPSRPKRRATRVDGYQRTPQRDPAPAPVPPAEPGTEPTGETDGSDPKPQPRPRAEPGPKRAAEPRRVDPGERARARREPDGFTPYDDLY